MTMNILIVEDGEINRKLLADSLKAEGYSVFLALDGVDALSVIDREEIHLIISDILMPNLDGYNLCRRIRETGSQSSMVPFILYTSTYGSPSDEKLAFDVGADRFIRKPASIGFLTSTIRDLTTDPRYSQPRSVAIPEEMSVVKHYSEALVRKLEEKNSELTAARELLNQANVSLLAQTAELHKMNVDLERRVYKRTAELLFSRQMLEIEVQERKAAQQEQARLVKNLQASLANVKLLTGLLPICAWCRKIRDDQGYWKELEEYLATHTELTVTHGICAECAPKFLGSSPPARVS
jgi:DNA-binding response OmpR family regulator